MLSDSISFRNQLHFLSSINNFFFTNCSIAALFINMDNPGIGFRWIKKSALHTRMFKGIIRHDLKGFSTVSLSPQIGFAYLKPISI